jgi:probable F420-dependent oxidoreductase
MLIDHYLRGDLPMAGELARDLEAIGFDGLYTAEGPHEPFFPLLLAAEQTTRPTLFTNIAVAFARSPMDLAQMANDLQHAAAGRFVLGLGSQIRPHIEHRFSMTWSRPVTRMREMVQAIKAIQTAWNDHTPLAFRGEIYRHTLMTPFFDPGPNPFGPPPVWVAALGPKMTACAAEVGDGLLVHPFHTGKFVLEHVAPSVDAGLDRSGRSRDAFTVSATPIVCTGSTDEEMERAVTHVRGLLGFYGSTPAYRVTLDAHGWGDLQTELNALTKQGRWDEIGSVIPDEVLETVAVHGAPEEIAGLLAARYGDAVDRVGLSMPYDASRTTLEGIVAGFRATSGTTS